MDTWAVTNEEQARSWNGDEAVQWLVHEERYERMLAPFTDRLLTSAAIGRADRVVDVGRGTGSTTGLLLGSRAWLVTASRPWR